MWVVVAVVVARGNLWLLQALRGEGDGRVPALAAAALPDPEPADEVHSGGAHTALPGMVGGSSSGPGGGVRWDGRTDGCADRQCAQLGAQCCSQG